MTTIRPNAGASPTQYTRQSQQASTAGTSTNRAASTGYSADSAFEQVKSSAADARKLLGEWEAPTGFSHTRLETLRNEANKKIDEMLSRSPPPSPEEARQELDLLVNKTQNQALIEDNMFKSLWNDLMASYERSLQAMNQSGS